VLGIPPAFILSQDQTLHDELTLSIKLMFRSFSFDHSFCEDLMKLFKAFLKSLTWGGFLLTFYPKSFVLKNRQTIVLSRFCAFG
jgi:hypothetical protein